MNMLAEDIKSLQLAADAASLVIYPGRSSQSFEDACTTVQPDTLGAFAADMERLRLATRDYDLIGYEAVWLLKAAQLLALYREDGDQVKAERFQKLCEYLRASIEVDLVNARKSLEVMG